LRQVRRYQISMVFQRFGLFPHRTVLENAAYGLEVRGVKKRERYIQARQMLELVGLMEWENYYPRELSGGMQQRVGLARALAVNPDILLCDEPFSALDPLIRREMQGELLRLQQRLHKTIIFITHDFLEALKLGDNIAIMKDGVIVQMGTPADIVAHPANEYVRAFTKDVPRAKILTAVSVMQPLNGKTQVSTPPIPAHTTLEELIPLTASTDEPFVVHDSEGQPIGQLDRTAVLLALADGLKADDLV
jgi:glycine betaine/proline transport system ATP-binding protein